MMKKNRDFQTSGTERISYGAYFFGQNIFYFILTQFFGPFMTDIGITAATAAVIMMVVKVWDAVNDPIFGGIVDRVHFKKGKFVPWLRISLILIPLSTIFLFAAPAGAADATKVVWVIVGYVLWDTAYTICDVPIYGLVTTMTGNLAERTSVMAVGRIFAGLGAASAVMLLPQIRQAVGGWMPSVAIASALALAVMAPVCFTAKERIAPPKTEAEPGLKEMLRFFKSNKYLLVFNLALVIAALTNISDALNVYFARYILGDERMLTLFAAIVLIPMLLASAFMPALVKKHDKFTMYFYAAVLTIVMEVIQFFVGYGNLTVLIITSILRYIPAGVMTALMFMFTPDVVEYGHYKTGVRASGIAFSVQTFTAKLTAAISGAVGLFALAVIGFIEGEGAAQLTGFNDKLWLLYTLMPCVGAALALPVLWKYKLRDKDVQIMTDFNSGAISREEAEKLLGERYK
ncbi:MAG TPA: glycoside-pentoside-hexuronide (GPH):cation symporter [Clostridia bacterium]|nr:glycoside-pentoside-hexuronide (GPH):cation symporter [Clostridia bacterium]